MTLRPTLAAWKSAYTTSLRSMTPTRSSRGLAGRRDRGGPRCRPLTASASSGHGGFSRGRATTYRLKGHRRTLTITGRKGRSIFYAASCECGWTDRPRTPRDAAKDFHVAHLQDAERLPRDRTMAADVAVRELLARRLPALGEVWELVPSGTLWVVSHLDPPEYKQREAYIGLYSVLDHRVTRRPVLASFLSRYVLAADAHAPTCKASDAAVIGGDSCA